MRSNIVRALGWFILMLVVSPALLHAASITFQQEVVYTCSMHPEVQSSKPGRCPKCAMQLVVKSVAQNQASVPAAATVEPGLTRQQSREIVPSSDGYTCVMHPEI